MRVKALLYMSILFMFISPAFAQINIKGKVLDEKNEPLSGASILIKSSKKGTTTGSDGSFTLSAQAGTKLLVDTLLQLKKKPKVLISSSATGKDFYIHSIVC